MLLAAILGQAAACSGETPADRVFLNGAVYTVDSHRSRAEAVAVRDGRIVARGQQREVRGLVGSATEVTELAGAMLLPGFHDSHIHILVGVATEGDCDLLRLESQEAVQARLLECRSLPGYGAERWVLGGGWSEWLWPDANPGKAQLDALFPDRPVYLESSFGHAAWVNSRALALAGVDRRTQDPPDGVIERDAATREPSGTLRDAAMLLVKEALPQQTLEQRLGSVRAGIDLAHSVGITAVIEPGSRRRADRAGGRARRRRRAFPARARLALADRLAARHFRRRRVRVPRGPRALAAAEPRRGLGQDLHGRRDRVRHRRVARALCEGRLRLGPRFYTQEQVNRYFTRFDAMGLQVHVHATGDAGIRMALDGFEAMREANGMSDNRHHIVHLQLIDEADRPRFAGLGITATFQPLWAYPDPAALELDIPMLGEKRTQEMYPIGSLARSGARIAAGSDYFVTDLNPLHAIEAAVTRQDPYTNAGPVLNADERVDLDTMIAAYTIQGAWLMGSRSEQGSIEVGKRADFVVLDRDLFAGPASAINEAKVADDGFRRADGLRGRRQRGSRRLTRRLGGKR